MPSEGQSTGTPHGLKLLRSLPGHGDVITRLSWSPDGLLLASPSYDTTIRVWDSVRWDVLRTLKGYPNRVACVAWSPDGRTLVSGAEYGVLRLWDVEDGSLLRESSRTANWFHSVAWSPDVSANRAV